MHPRQLPLSPNPAALPRTPVLVLGSGGRIGQFLVRSWGAQPPAGLRPLWHERQARPSAPGHLAWDLLAQPLPGAWCRWAAAGTGSGPVMLCLAGVVAGDDAALAQNSALALAALEAGQAIGARHVFLCSSAAVYGSASGPQPETAVPRPCSAYGAAKLAMEHTALAWHARQAQAPGLTLLRIGNVAGADALLGGAVLRPGPVALDRFANGHGPSRSYIGPGRLAAVLARLVAMADAGGAARLPRVLNLAEPGPVAMQALLRAAALPWHWRAAPATALQAQALDLSRLARLMPLPVADPARMVAEWRALAPRVARRPELERWA